MLSSKFISAMRIIYEALPVDEINWAITGTASLCLQNVDVEAHEINILTCKNSAYEVERRLKRFAMKSVEYAEDIGSSSYFGMLSIDGVDSEIIGDRQSRGENNEWSPPDDVIRNRHFIDYEGMRLPVTILEYEAGMLREAGDEKTAVIVEALIGEKVGR